MGNYLESFARGSFTRSLTRQAAVPLLPFHDRHAIPVGVAEAWQDEPEGLYGVFRMHLTAAGQVAADYAERGIVAGLSIGFLPSESRWSYAGEYAPERGTAYMDSVVRTQARLAEVSLVSTPAYVDARVTGVEFETVDA